MATIEEGLTQALIQLRDLISKTVDEGTARGELQPETITFERDVDIQFDHTEHGLVRKSFRTELVPKKSWGEAAHKVLHETKNSPEYSHASQLLTQCPSIATNSGSLLGSFSSELAIFFLEKKEPQERKGCFENVLTIALKHARNEKLQFTGEVKLLGIIPPPASVTFTVFDTTINLRRLTEQDYQCDRMHSSFRELGIQDPSAILELRGLSHEPVTIDHKVRQSITILRLFGVSSAQFLSYSINSESLISSGHQTGNSRHYVVYEKCLIQQRDVERLKTFWYRMSEGLPQTGYELATDAVRPVEIAYQRYTNALVLVGTVEKRIADAVMGLESLLLTGDENQELSYRLRIRVARILGLLGAEPQMARDTTNDAYTIRSNYVHGDIVAERKRKSIEKKHGSLNSLLNSVLNQLRICIIVFTVLNIQKKSLISVLDESFIDPAKSPELEMMLSAVKDLV